MKTLIHRYIDREALRHNFDHIKRLAPNSRVIAMIKANAYGHGLITCAKTLVDAEAFGVARIEEVFALRQAKITQRIILTHGFIFKENLPLLTELDCEIVIHNHAQLKHIINTPIKKPLKLWLKINTGLNRFGFKPEDIDMVHQQLSHCPHVQQPINLMSHAGWTSTPKHQQTDLQCQCFYQATKHLPGEKSFAKSGVILHSYDICNDWIRPGILLYGVSPFINSYGNDFNLRPVMHFRSQLIAIRHQKKGDTIGYDGIWQCDEDLPVGIAAVGYGDGYPGNAPSGTPILVDNKICHLVGKVAMDILHIDLRHKPDAKIGDPVTLWGPGLAVEDIAHHCQTSPYILLTANLTRQPIN